MAFELKRMDPLFASPAEYEAFMARHAKAVVPKGDLSTYSGKCFLGIDAGSTTTKIAVIGEQGELLFSWYDSNQGSPIHAAMRAMKELYEVLPGSAQLARTCSTGCG